jgi:hypothetical protein
VRVGLQRLGTISAVLQRHVGLVDQLVSTRRILVEAGESASPEQPVDHRVAGVDQDEHLPDTFLPRTWSSVRRARSRQASTARRTWIGTMIAASSLFRSMVMISICAPCQGCAGGSWPRRRRIGAEAPPATPGRYATRPLAVSAMPASHEALQALAVQLRQASEAQGDPDADIRSGFHTKDVLCSGPATEPDLS